MVSQALNQLIKRCSGCRIELRIYKFIILNARINDLEFLCKISNNVEKALILMDLDYIK
jgi:hypothetical protein